MQSSGTRTCLVRAVVSVSVLATASALASCGSGAKGSDVSVRMGFVRDTNDFYTAPFPSEDLRSPDGTIDLDDYPGPRDVLLAGDALEIANHRIRGFGNTSPIFFTFDGLPGPGTTVPTPDGSLLANATVQLFDVSVVPPAPQRIRVGVIPYGGVFGTSNMLALLPVQGLHLEPGHRYAAIVRRAFGDSEGVPLAVSAGMKALARGEAPEGLNGAAATAYLEAVEALRDGGIRIGDLAGIAVYETQDPVAELREYYAHLRSLARPTLEAPLTLMETHPDYCVFRSTIRMPSYQSGQSPFANEGGGWARDSAGNPEVQETLLSNVVVTVPRASMPASGFPTLIYIRAGGGGLQPLVDRGVHAVAHVESPPGTGPAMIFAQAGFAAISIDGPVGGLRNPTSQDEQFLLFNSSNATALLDNLRQTAIETGLTAYLLDDFLIASATAGCAGLTVPVSETNIRFDTTRLAVFGHSMGASIAPLAAAVEPRLRAVILSGAGASWAENMIYKEEPIAIRGVLAGQFDVIELTRLDPGVGLVQWVGESADAQVYARHLVRQPLDGSSPRHVLMFQGMVDHYIMPPIANVLAIAGGFDLAGQGLEAGIAEIADLEPLASLLPWSGRSVVPYPVSANVATGATNVTAVVVQHPEDGIEDGHEVFFQLEGPRHQARCYLESYAATGTPVVVAPASLATPCP
jgi:hypothetical protein